MSGTKYPGGLNYPGSSGPYVSYGYTTHNEIHRGQTLVPGASNIELRGDSLASLSPDLQSPGHDSVSSSVTVGSGASSGCRHSTTSTDSGRGSSISTSSVTRPTTGHTFRLSNVSSSQSSVCSSSSSIQDRPEDRIFSLNIQEMINNGLADEDILLAWLSDLHFEEYFNLFISAGYDMPTISRMTPEDLTAIGIKNPAHRKKLKSEISKLNISDGIPNHIPGSLEEWLRLLRLEEYGPCLVSQGYSSVQEVATISIEDLEDTGFYRLGHQKRLTLGIRRLKEVSRGRVFSQQPQFIPAQTQEISSLAAGSLKTGQFSSFHQPVVSSVGSPFNCRKVVMVEHHQQHQQQHHQQHQQQHLPQLQQHHQAELVSSVPVPEPMAPLQYPLYKQSLGVVGTQYPGSPRFTPRASGGLGHPPEPQSQYRMMRSYDDADIVRRSDNSILVHEAGNSRVHMGGETLPRLKAGNLKPKPVAKIIANTRNTVSQEDIDRDWEEVQKLEEIQICDNICSSGTSSPNMTLRKARSGSDAGIQAQLQMKRNSSFGSETGIPFANDNAGTIRIRSNSHIVLQERNQQTPAQKRSAGDVLQDIGSMLSDLTDELDAMLKLEKDTD